MLKKILIIDDDIALADMLRMQFAAAGHEVSVVNDGREGLEKVKALNPDLIVLDVLLPNLDGYQICRLLKFNESYKKIPIIMCTSLAEQEKEKIGKEVGANAYFPKPYDLKELLAKAEELLKTANEKYPPS